MNKAFTLIELLIVIAVAGVLATVAVMILNPGEIMKEIRDSRRFEDLNHINIAITEAQSLSPNINLGVASSVYVSIPDSSATCANLGLSTSSLPSGWSYKCSTSANFKKVDGTGWIPVNFSAVEGGSVFASIPVDPVNATSSGLYYTYTPGVIGGFQLAGLFESYKHADKAAKDGGADPAQYEVGDNLSIAPFSHGLAGKWNFDETGTTAIDSSGISNIGTMYSSTTPTNLHTSSGCKSNLGTCVILDGEDDYIDITGRNWVNNTPVSVVFWNKEITTQQWGVFEIGLESGSRVFHIHFHQPNFEWHYGKTPSFNVNYSAYVNNWTHVAAVSDGLNGKFYGVYFNGSLAGSTSPGNGTNSALTGMKISRSMNDTTFYNGSIDEFYIYSRVLSSAQIKAIYDATK